MEEFYRKKYLSPSYTRTASYVDTLEKDKTVAELRKELQDCKEMEEKFDDLCLEIVKLERENKKLESDQSQVEGDYMQKVKNNKNKITELKQTILDHREQLEAKTAKITGLEAEN
jgi:gas vesicle protein